MTSLPVGSIIRNSNTLFCCVRKGYWRPLKASGLGPGGFSDDELNDMGVSDLVLRGDGEIEDAAELYQKVIRSQREEILAFQRGEEISAFQRVDIEKEYLRLYYGLPRTGKELTELTTNLKSANKNELVGLIKNANNKDFKKYLHFLLERYTGRGRWLRKEYVSREDGTTKNIITGTRVTTRTQPQWAGTSQGSVPAGSGIVEETTSRSPGFPALAKKAIGVSSALFVRFDPEIKEAKIEETAQPEESEEQRGGGKSQHPPLNWVVVHADAYGKPTERHARLPRLFWPDLAVVDYMSGPRYGARGRYEILRRMTKETGYFAGESADEAWGRTGFDFNNLTDLWKHLDEERELRLGKKR